MTDKEKIAALEVQLAAQQQALEELRSLVLSQSQPSKSKKVTVNRRRWLKQLAVAAGGLAIAGATLQPEKASAATVAYNDSITPVVSTTYTGSANGFALDANVSVVGGTSSAAVRANNNGAGNAIYAQTASNYSISAVHSGAKAAIYAANINNGNGIEINNGQTTKDGLNVTTTSSSSSNAGVYSVNFGGGYGVYAQSGASSNHALYAKAVNAASTVAAVRAENTGGGYGVYATTGDNGTAAVYAKTTSTNASTSAMYVENAGAGTAFWARTYAGGDSPINAVTESTTSGIGAVSAFNYGAGYAVQALAGITASHGVYAVAANTTSSDVAAIYAKATGKANGISATTANGTGKAAIFSSAANFAQLHLVSPLTGIGAPTGPHTQGEFYVDSIGTLWYCTGDGTPGTWVKMSNDTSAIPVYTPVAPFRLVDTVNGTTFNPAGALDGFGTVANADTIKKTYQVDTSSVPTNAKAIFGYAYVHQNVDRFKVEPGYGYLTLWKSGDTYPQVVPGVEGLNTLRYIKGAAASTFFCVPLGGRGKFLAASKYTVHLAIDIVGYFA